MSTKMKFETYLKLGTMEMAQLKRVIGLNMAIFLVFSSFSSAFQLELMHEDLEI